MGSGPFVSLFGRSHDDATASNNADFRWLETVMLRSVPAMMLRSVPAMPLYFFRIRNGRFSGASEHGTECADRDAAWKEMTSVCADMAARISRKLTENSEWQMEMLDEANRVVFRIRIVAETLDHG
jgi:hypothetical protein